tara:strand:- start:325 stop:750 length:426 start_codon:yes stop_codon:yes gene_type:complete
MKSENLPRHARTRLLKCLPKVCDYWNVDADEVLGRSRKRNIINAKHSLRYFLNTYGDLTACDIGALTNCDHSSVLHSIKTFKVYCEYDEDFRTFKRIVLRQTVSDIDYSLSGKIRKVIKSNNYLSKKVELIKKIFDTNEYR